MESIHGLRVELDHGLRSHRFIYYGLYEESILNYLRRRLKPGMVVLDPGANVGYLAARCLGMVMPGGKVHSFEPSPTCVKQLLRANPSGSVPGWTLFTMALTDHSGRMTFYDTPRVLQKGYACLADVNVPKDGIPGEVEVTTVDAHCALHGIDRVDFLKLDIEGSELPALHGAKEMLARRAISTILVEVKMTASTRQLTADIDQLLRAAGFASYLPKRDGTLVPIEVMEHPRLDADIIWESQPA